MLGTGSFGKVMVRTHVEARSHASIDLNYQRATWHVPAGQIPTAQRGAAAVCGSPSSPANGSGSLPRPATISREHSTSSVTSAFLSLTRSSSHNNQADSGVIVDVALKVIPKKKVKGNEDSVWGEMEVLKGLDHKNIVSISYSSSRFY